MKYSIIIPTYGTQKPLLQKCVSSVLATTNMDGVEIIVSSNACTDDTNDYLAAISDGDQIKFISTDERIGHGLACNRAVELAKGDFIIKLDNDIIILDWGKDRWIQQLRTPFMSNVRAGIVGCVSKCHEVVGRKFLIGFVLMLPRGLYNQIGGFDDVFRPGYGDDIDLCWKVEDSGYVAFMAGDNPNSQGIPINDCPSGFQSSFPIYHAATSSYSDAISVEKWDRILAERYVSPIVFKNRYGV